MLAMSKTIWGLVAFSLLATSPMLAYPTGDASEWFDAERCIDWAVAKLYDRKISSDQLKEKILAGPGTDLYGEFLVRCKNAKEQHFEKLFDRIREKKLTADLDHCKAWRSAKLADGSLSKWELARIILSSPGTYLYDEFLAECSNVQEAMVSQLEHDLRNHCLDWGVAKMIGYNITTEELKIQILSGPGTQLYEEFLVDCESEKDKKLALLLQDMTDHKWWYDYRHCQNWQSAAQEENDLSSWELATIILDGPGTDLYEEFLVECENTQDYALKAMADDLHEHCMDWGVAKLKEYNITSHRLKNLIFSDPGTELYEEFHVHCKNEPELGRTFSGMAQMKSREDFRKCDDWLAKQKMENNLSKLELAKLLRSGRGTEFYGRFLKQCHKFKYDVLNNLSSLLGEWRLK